MKAIELTTLKDKLAKKGYNQSEVGKFIAYLDNAIRDEAGKEASKQLVTRNSLDNLYSLATKFFNMGVTIDGINAVISGNNMVMVTYHGYKNAVLKAYPEATIDLQLIRKGDSYNFAKESGSVIYSHSIGDPFQTTEQPIIGAYVVFKTKRGEFLETLNITDFDKMKKASKMPYLWNNWESEFWLKSVIKRACKRHFYDVVADIDKQDNSDFGADTVNASDDKKASIIAAAKNGNVS